MKLLEEVIESADDLLNACPPCEPGSANHERQKRLREALERLKGCASLSGSIYLDVQLITKRAKGRDWYFVLDPNGKLQAVFRQRGVLDTVDGSVFRMTR